MVINLKAFDIKIILLSLKLQVEELAVKWFGKSPLTLAHNRAPYFIELEPMVVKKAHFAVKIKLVSQFGFFQFPHKAKCCIISNFIIKYSASLLLCLWYLVTEQEGRAIKQHLQYTREIVFCSPTSHMLLW